MHAEGWRRLWELLKWTAAIATGLFVSFKLIQTSPHVPEAGNNQLGIGIFLGGVLAGLAVYGMLHAFEWVYRGFRPLPVSPTGEAHPDPQAEPSDTPPTTVEALEHHPALPHPDSQRMNERQQQR